ncbi:hypothetical protein DITRI_Ditri12bG0165300 [Diplodiscus trichospermus]
MMDDPHLEDSPSSEQSPVVTPTTVSPRGNARPMNRSAVKKKNEIAGFFDSSTKKKATRMPGGGLRQFSVMVCKMLESKGSTTYAEVADEIMEEFTATQTNPAGSLDEFHEKNVRRRVYDVLNVLMALDIVTKEKKEIRWNGLYTAQRKDFEELKAVHVQLVTGIARKAEYLKDLEEQTSSHATVEIEISEDMQLVHLDFNRQYTVLLAR